uniref:Uncharacterized protein n=1 Tax=Arundo donax TaxID=35708 RepID=A0A0A8YII4_ARUDO
MAAANKIHPSQLAKEQHNATRLWRQLEHDVRATLELRAPLTQDAKDRVLALDAVCPLPLLPGMQEKFPKTVELARWCPRRHSQHQLKKKSKSFSHHGGNSNGWKQELEDAASCVCSWPRTSTSTYRAPRPQVTFCLVLNLMCCECPQTNLWSL